LIIAQKGKDLCIYGVKIEECVTKLMDLKKKICRFEVDMWGIMESRFYLFLEEIKLHLNMSHTNFFFVSIFFLKWSYLFLFLFLNKENLNPNIGGIKRKISIHVHLYGSHGDSYYVKVNNINLRSPKKLRCLNNYFKIILWYKWNG